MRYVRKSGLFFLFFALGVMTTFTLFLAYPLLSRQEYRSALEKKKELVQKLGITDLCIFTEAPYTRHLSQADNFSAFKDSPLVFEHFPSGSMTLPPQLAGRELYPVPGKEQAGIGQVPEKEKPILPPGVVKENMK